MSKLSVDQKTINDLFSDKNTNFLIPDYQRPYAWTKAECATLWDDIFAFAFPGDDYSRFDDKNDEYFLGPIVTFKNGDDKLEVIDGQQRLTTLMLLLRAFHAKFGNMQDGKSKATRSLIEQCIWQTDPFGEPDWSELKINSEVATDSEKEEFLSILKSGVAPSENKSVYALNYRFFEEKIDWFLKNYPAYFSYLPIRILKNCILLPIEAESQDTALRIFSTLNDRGKPLSDSDIFKAQLYKFYADCGEKDKFIEEWKALEELVGKTFHPTSGTPMDELFSRYMYYERAKKGIKDSTTEALRKFYEKDSYRLLKNKATFENLKTLAAFWADVACQNRDRFSLNVLRRLFVLNYAPNGMWTYFVSVFFMHNKDDQGILDDEKFDRFLSVSTAFIWTYAVKMPGVGSLRTPIYAEMVNIVKGVSVEFADYKFDASDIQNLLRNFNFNNARPITKSMLAWWALHSQDQPLLSLETVFEIEHIYARNRYEKENTLVDPKCVERLGNKSLLEKRVNIRASDYRFEDKKRYYAGYITKKGVKKEGTEIQELHTLATSEDFVEKDIMRRDAEIFTAFLSFLKSNNLIQ